MTILSIIVPVLNESASAGHFFHALRQSVDKAIHSSNPVLQSIEIIAVDGGSDDNTVDIVRPYADQVCSSAKGRALQMNAGVLAAKGDLLLFLHSDTVLPEQAFPFIDNLMPDGCFWGFYPLKLSGSHSLLRIIEYMISKRSKITGIATGDQCIFMCKSLFASLGGYAEIPLMEDVEISKRLRKHSAPLVLDQAVVTSSRRWEKHGIIKTVMLMWLLRAAYFCNISPKRLAAFYYG